MFSIDSLYLIFLATGITVGFGHCLGMCGPIAVSFSIALKEKACFIPHLLYNAGRISTYAILGGIMGATGSFAMVATRIAIIQKGVMILTGLMIIAMGAAMAGWFSFGRIFSDAYHPSEAIAKRFRALSKVKSSFAYFPMGLMLGLLPCGPVYTALLAAARGGMERTEVVSGIIFGMSLMVCFGAGTIPALLLVSRLAAFDWLPSRTLIYRVTSFFMIIVGAYYLVKGIRY